MPATVVQLGGRGVGVANVALHVFQTGAVVEGGGDERRPHRVGAVPAVEPNARRVFAEDAVDADRVERAPRIAADLVLANRPEQRALRIVAVAGSGEVVSDPLCRLPVEQARVDPRSPACW